MTDESFIEGVEGLRRHARVLSPLRISDRRAILIGMDLIVVNLALLLAVSWRAVRPVTLGTMRDHPLWFAVLSGCWLIAAYSFDLYHLRIARKLGATIPAVVKAGMLAAGVFLLIPYVTPPFPSSRLPLLALPLSVTAAVLIWRSIYILTLPQPFLQQRVLILGAGNAGQLIARTLAEEAGPEYQLVGFLDDAVPSDTSIMVQESRPPRAAADHPPSRPLRLPILGSSDYLGDGVARYRITTLVLSLPQQLESRLLQALMECAERGIQVIPMSALYEQLTGRVPVEHLHENWYVALPVYHRDHSPLWRFSKRVMDIVLAGIGLLALGAVLPVVAIALFVDSPGPLFYTQHRVGKGGRLFRVYKFRSMRVGAENGSAMWAQENDPRTTRLGRLLRATHVDELPQFLNVLRGEMSAVGPRPERPEFVGALAAAAPFYPLRHTVKPGMAGWALVKQGYASTPEDLRVRLQYDFYYIKHQSLWFDLLILCKTFGHALGFRGR